MRYRVIARGCAVLVAAIAFALTISGPALGGWYIYAQKTWLQGWDASSVYDYPGARYLYSDMYNKSCRCYGRVALIDTSGNWRRSWTDATEFTTVYEYNDAGYTKKGYCKNNSGSVYTASCIVEWA